MNCRDLAYKISGQSVAQVAWMSRHFMAIRTDKQFVLTLSDYSFHYFLLFQTILLLFPSHLPDVHGLSAALAPGRPWEPSGQFGGEGAHPAHPDHPATLPPCPHPAHPAHRLPAFLTGASLGTTFIF